MKADVVITMSIAESRELKKVLENTMETVKEKVSQLDMGQEKSLAIHNYKELEKLKNTLT